jgi:hypothetical protein
MKSHLLKAAQIDWAAVEDEALGWLLQSEHDWDLDEDGRFKSEADWLSQDGLHFGPQCRCCGYEPCLRCVGRPDTCIAVEMTCGC